MYSSYSSFRCCQGKTCQTDSLQNPLAFYVAQNDRKKAVQTTDRYKRYVARVSCNGVDANAAQLSRGMAWVYDKYVEDMSLYAVQDEAVQAKRGFWADTSPIPPWEWRRSRK